MSFDEDMDLPAVQVRVIRKVTDLEELIGELTSPYCTFEALKVEIGDGVDSLALVGGDEIRKQLAGALGASKKLKSLDVPICFDMLKVDDLYTLLKFNKVLKSLTVSTQFVESGSLMMMLKRNSTLNGCILIVLGGFLVLARTCLAIRMFIGTVNYRFLCNAWVSFPRYTLGKASRDTSRGTLGKAS